MQKISSPEIQNFETEHIKRLRAIAPECMVLLKKNGDFPLSGPCRIALYGSGARKTIKGGTGSGDVNVRHFVSVEEGLENAGFTVTSKNWLDSYDAAKDAGLDKFYDDINAQAKALGKPAFLLGLGKLPPEPEFCFPIDAECETGIYVLARNSGEGSDRKAEKGDFLLTDDEIRDILICAEKYERFMLVLNVGGPVDLSPVLDSVENILLLSQLGSVTGDAFADVLLGKAYPSGKLTATWAKAEAYPSTEGFAEIDDTRYTEGVYVGYRYFETAGVAPIFPFGFGLGYTEFETIPEGVRIDGGSLIAEATVRNSGKFPGKETVQLYYSAPSGKLDRPLRELGAYVKTRELLPGESETLTLEVPIRNMAGWDSEAHAWLLEAGEYILYIGKNAVCKATLSDCIFSTKFTAVNGKPDFKDLQLAANRQAYNNIPRIILPADSNHLNGTDTPVQESAADSPNLKSFSDEELARICTGKFSELQGIAAIIGNSSYKVAGAAGESADILEERGFGKLVMADGPAGLRVARSYIERNNGAASLDFGSMEPMLRFFDVPIRALFKAKQNEAKLEAKLKTTYHHYASAIPIGTALAQAWNPEVPRACGDIVGDEMELFGVNVWLAPALNIQRNPLCGRNFEYYSEDPLLSGKTAAAVTLGVQAHPKCAVTIKHFCCNNQETNRFGSNSIVSERALREIYLKGFEICVKEAAPICLMSSYNLLNSTHTANRKDLFEDILRGEWGFNGLVMTDWGTTGNSFNLDKYGPSSAAGCIKAGNDLIMSGSKADVEGIVGALQEGSLSRSELEKCAGRVLKWALKLKP